MPPPEYSQFYEGFDVSELGAELEGSLTKGLNACVECCDRHVSGDRVALFWEGRSAVRLLDPVVPSPH